MVQVTVVQPCRVEIIFSPPKDRFCLEKLANAATLLLELAIFSIFAMFWTKKIILTFGPPEVIPRRAANYDGGSTLHQYSLRNCLQGAVLLFPTGNVLLV